MPLVSVITPAYNAARWIGETIASVRAQTHGEWEMLVVDDGSRDDTVAAARAAAADDPRVRVLTQPNAGPSVARNTGLALARGDYLQYLDADDLLAADKIERQLRRLAAAPGYVASGEWARIYGDQTADAATFEPERVWADLDAIDWFVESSLGGGMMATAAWLVPREVAERAGPWSPVRSPNDDGEYFNRVRLASAGVLFVPGARTYYRTDVGGWSGAASRRALEGTLHSFADIQRQILAVEDSPRTRRAMAANYQRFVFSTYPDHPDLVAEAEARIAALGGGPLRPRDGGVFGAVARVTGWKVARRLQRLRRRA